MSMGDDPEQSNRSDDWENRATVFVKKLQSVLEQEEQGEISPESVEKIKELLKEFWKQKSDQLKE